MYPISPLYADSLKLPNRTIIGKANVAGVDYGNTIVVGWSIENTISKGEGLDIGTAIPSKLTITLRMRDEVPANAKIIPYLAASTGSLTWEQADYPWDSMEIPWIGGLTEWLPLGEFYVDSRERVNDTWVYTCYDKLVWADVPYISSLSYPSTQKAVWDEICGRLGYTYDNSVAINTGYMVPIAPTGYSMRQVLGYIAGANAACLFAGKDGVLRFKRFSASTQPVFEFTQKDYFRVKQTNPFKTYSRLVVTYNQEDDLSYTAGTGDDNHTLEMDNPLMTQAMVNDVQAAINGMSYLPITMDAKGFPQLDQGDVVQFEQAASLTWLEATTPWEQMDVPWDGVHRYQTIILHQRIDFKGGLKMTVEVPSVSAQQSEFAVPGTLTQQVAKINQTAVKEGKRYYGVMVSRAEGFTVQVEGTNARAVFNADELSFYDDSGNRALWFDIPSHRFKFDGDLEAAGGTFTGDLSAAGGTFSGALQAATGTFAGALQAATGTFSGDLSAAGGTFTGDLSAAGGTFSGTLQAVDGVFTGTLQGVDGSFSGAITASTIDGGTITGANIRTSPSGGRVEMSAIGWNAFDTAGVRRIGIALDTQYGMSAIEWYGESGGRVGLINGVDDVFMILSTIDMMIQSFGWTYMNGGIDFSQANVTGLPISAITLLEQRLAAKATAGVQTSSAGPYNCGIPIGTMLAVAGGGSVQWMGVPAFSLTQN